MEFSPLQCTEKVGDKVGDKVRDKFTTLSGTCPGLCRKVGVMEFGLYGLIGLRKEDEHPAYAPVGYGTFTFTYWHNPICRKFPAVRPKNCSSPVSPNIFNLRRRCADTEYTMHLFRGQKVACYEYWLKR